MINGLKCSGRSDAFRIIAVRLCLPRRFLLPHIFFYRFTEYSRRKLRSRYVCRIPQDIECLRSNPIVDLLVGFWVKKVQSLHEAS